MLKMLKKTKVLFIAFACMLSLCIAIMFAPQVNQAAAQTAESSEPALYDITVDAPEEFDLYLSAETVEAGEIFSLEINLWPVNPYSGESLYSENGIQVIEEYGVGKTNVVLVLAVEEGGGCVEASFWCNGPYFLGTVVITATPQKTTVAAEYDITVYAPETFDLYLSAETVKAGEIFSLEINLWPVNPYSGESLYSENGIQVIEEYGVGKTNVVLVLAVEEGGGCVAASFWCNGPYFLGTVVIIATPQTL